MNSINAGYLDRIARHEAAHAIVAIHHGLDATVVASDAWIEADGYLATAMYMRCSDTACRVIASQVGLAGIMAEVLIREPDLDDWGLTVEISDLLETISDTDLKEMGDGWATHISAVRQILADRAEEFEHMVEQIKAEVAGQFEPGELD